jgi:hypothetical protein
MDQRASTRHRGEHPLSHIGDRWDVMRNGAQSYRNMLGEALYEHFPALQPYLPAPASNGKLDAVVEEEEGMIVDA